MGTRLQAFLAGAAPVLLPALAALAAMAPATGCAPPADTELTLRACDDGDDNDGDGLRDCADPDCQQLALCRGEGFLAQGISGTGLFNESLEPMTPAEPPAQPPPPPPPAVDLVGARTPPQDGPTAGAAAPPAMPTTPDMAPQQPPASPEPPAPDDLCDGGCGDGARCLEGTCVADDPAPVQRWRMTQLSVVVPRSIDGGETCLDDNCLALFGPPPFLGCGCYPDPIVTAYVDDVLVFESEVAADSASATWPLDVEVQLHGDSRVQLKVHDDDTDDDGNESGGGRGALAYYCIADSSAEALATGTLGCSETFRTDTGELTATVSVTIVPVD